MKRLIWTLIAICIALVLAYLSRFWIFNWWGRDGLLGFEALRPQGGLLGRWLRGTPVAPFELVLWVLGGFLILTWVQKIYDWFGPKE